MARIMEHYGLSARELADTCGVQRSAVSHIMNGRNRPSVSFLTALSDAYPEMNTRWLLHGKGEMITDVNTNVNTDRRSSSDAPLNEAEKPSDSSRQTSSATKKAFTDVYTNVNASSKGKSIKQVIVLYEDGSFDAFSPSNSQSV